jgi:hypothetical protein
MVVGGLYCFFKIWLEVFVCGVVLGGLVLFLFSCCCGWFLGVTTSCGVCGFCCVFGFGCLLGCWLAAQVVTSCRGLGFAVFVFFSVCSSENPYVYDIFFGFV